MITLYYSPGACSLSPHIALCEAGLPYRLVRVDLGAHRTEAGEDFYTINPFGYVPVLELEDGTRLREGPAIVQYIADQAPDKRLAPPAGTLERYRLQQWLNFLSTEIHKTFSPLFAPALPEAVHDWARGRLADRFSVLVRELTGPYLMGERFTVADGYLFTLLGWTKPVKFDLAPWPALVEYRKRVGERPAVQQALRAEGLLP